MYTYMYIIHNALKECIYRHVTFICIDLCTKFLTIFRNSCFHVQMDLSTLFSLGDSMTLVWRKNTKLSIIIPISIIKETK